MKGWTHPLAGPHRLADRKIVGHEWMASVALPMHSQLYPLLDAFSKDL
jgi:hypothetical protein